MEVPRTRGKKASLAGKPMKCEPHLKTVKSSQSASGNIL